MRVKKVVGKVDLSIMDFYNRYFAVQGVNDLQREYLHKMNKTMYSKKAINLKISSSQNA